MAQGFFTDDGSADFSKATAYALLKWGAATRESENNAVKAIVAALEHNPRSGTVPVALSDIGMHDFRQSLTVCNRVFHDYDQASGRIYILMVSPQTRDFPSHLAKRMLSPLKIRAPRA